MEDLAKEYQRFRTKLFWFTGALIFSICGVLFGVVGSVFNDPNWPYIGLSVLSSVLFILIGVGCIQLTRLINQNREKFRNSGIESGISGSENYWVAPNQADQLRAPLIG